MTVSTIARPFTRSRRARVGAGLYTPAGMGPREAPRPPRGRRRTKLARELTAARLHAGLTQAALAQRLGVGLSTLQTWERGTAKPHGLYLRAVEAFLAEQTK